MDALRHLLGRPGAHDQAEVLAAAVIEQVNTILYRDYELGPDLARAIRYRANEILIETTHGAVTAKLQVERDSLAKKIQARMHELFPGQRIFISRVSIRTI